MSVFRGGVLFLLRGVDSPFELVPNSLVEVPEKWGWIPARIIDEPYMDRAWVSLENGSKKEVDIFTLRFLEINKTC